MTAHCSHCGSEEIRVKADLVWDKETQDWAIDTIQNSGVCPKCHWRDHVQFCDDIRHIEVFELQEK